jgi:hypothetical protein
MVPNGETPDFVKNHPALKGVEIPRTGQPGRTGVLITKTLLFAGDGSGLFSVPPGAGGLMFRSYNKQTGAVVSEFKLPASDTGVPMTYLLKGRQYIVLAVGDRGAGGTSRTSAREARAYRALPVVAACVLSSSALAGAQTVTFVSDVAPILQEKCQECHRPGTGAPMSLVTYQEVRPWARAIKRSVSRREMPPWHIDRHAGIQHFKNDRSLTADQIDLLVKWADAGAPEGDGAASPGRIAWPDADQWKLGTPDLLIAVPTAAVPASGPDRLIDYTLPIELTEDRYIRAVETKPDPAGRRVVHHVVTYLSQRDSDVAASYLSEYAVGKDAEVFPSDAGRLVARGVSLPVNVHVHPNGEAATEQIEIGLFLYPRGTEPRYRVSALTVGLFELDNELEIPANRVSTQEAAATLTRPAVMISFQPHMHMRGTAMLIEAIEPDGRRQMLGAVDRYDFNAQVAYVYADEARPVLPAGTVLHVIATYDNTAANRNNPDPDQWIDMAIARSTRCYSVTWCSLISTNSNTGS